MQWPKKIVKRCHFLKCVVAAGAGAIVAIGRILCVAPNKHSYQSFQADWNMPRIIIQTQYTQHAHTYEPTNYEEEQIICARAKKNEKQT